MKVDVNATLVARKEVVVDAPVERVWEVQADIEAWPVWQEDVSEARLEGELERGTRFVWKAMGMKIVSRLESVEKNKEIGWSGKALGMQARHVWRFERMGAKTKVVTEESMSGWLVKLLKLVDHKFLEKSLTKSVETLKDHVETSK